MSTDSRAVPRGHRTSRTALGRKPPVRRLRMGRGNGCAGERGQATVELVAFLPLLAAVVAAVLCVLAAGRAREVAEASSQAGAMALMRGADARDAATSVVPEDLRRGARVEVRGRRVTVEVVPRLPVPGLADRLASTSTADAGSAP